MLERVVFRDATGRVRHCTVEDWEDFIEALRLESSEVRAVELCRVSSREEAMRFVNLAREDEDGKI